MRDSLSLSEVKEYIKKAEKSFRHEECRTCECFLGYVTQLQIDTEQEAKQFLMDYQPPREEIHTCLGCDPCAPGILYTQYIIRKPKD